MGSLTTIYGFGPGWFVAWEWVFAPLALIFFPGYHNRLYTVTCSLESYTKAYLKV